MANNRKKKVSYFVSYAHADNEMEGEIVNEFIKELENNFKSSKNYSYNGWMDKNILPGENWKKEIKKAINNCDFGLLLISLNFLNSTFISKEELPEFVSGKYRAIPVGLKFVSAKKHDLRGLDQSQIFILGKSFYAQCEKNEREDFVFQLYERIEMVLDDMESLSSDKELNVADNTKEHLAIKDKINSEINNNQNTHQDIVKWLQRFIDSQGDRILEKVIKTHSETDLRLPKNQEEIEDFALDIKKFTKRICYSIINENTRVINSPRISCQYNMNTYDPCLYKDFFLEIAKFIPPDTPEESRIKFEEYINYLFSRFV